MKEQMRPELEMSFRVEALPAPQFGPEAIEPGGG